MDSNGSLVAGPPNVEHRSEACVYTANSTVGLIGGSPFPFVSQLSAELRWLQCCLLEYSPYRIHSLLLKK